MKFIRKNGRVIPVAEPGDHKGTVNSIAKKGKKAGEYVEKKTGKSFRLMKSGGTVTPGIFGVKSVTFAKARVVGKVYK